MLLHKNCKNLCIKLTLNCLINNKFGSELMRCKTICNKLFLLIIYNNIIQSIYTYVRIVLVNKYNYIWDLNKIE